MDPLARFRHDLDCPARGQLGQGNIRVHSRKERRFARTIRGRTFAATRGAPFYRGRTDPDLMTIVPTPLTHGCPLQAIGAAYGLDERTVAARRAAAGGHARRLHAHFVRRGGVDLRHVQADELWVKTVGGRVWPAMAMAVPSRLWPAGAISPHRDLTRITRLVQVVRSCAKSPAFLVRVDGLAGYVTAFTRALRRPVRTGRAGRPRLVEEAGLWLGQVIRRRVGRCVTGVGRRVIRGTAEAIAAVLSATGTGTGINTA
jgi:hypothetical protein